MRDGDCERRRAVLCGLSAALCCGGFGVVAAARSLLREGVNSCNRCCPLRLGVLSRRAEWVSPSHRGDPSSRHLSSQRGQAQASELTEHSERRQRKPAAHMSTATYAGAARSPSDDGAAPDLAVDACSAARWCWGSNGSGCLGVGHQNDLHTPTLCCPSSAREAAEEADRAEPSRAAASASAAASAVPAIVASSPSGCVRFTRISCGGCHTLAIDGQMQAR